MLESSQEGTQEKITSGRGMVLLQSLPIRGGGFGGSKSLLHRRWLNTWQSEATVRLRKSQRKKHYRDLIFYLWCIYRNTYLKPRKYCLMSSIHSNRLRNLGQRCILTGMFFARCSFPHRFKCFIKGLYHLFAFHVFIFLFYPHLKICLLSLRERERKKETLI